MNKERPILFSAPMVLALLAGTKTQTRRVMRIQPPANTVQVSTWHHPSPRQMFYAWARNGEPVADHATAGAEISDWPPAPCPYGQPGDRLWVRETWYCDDYRVQRGPYLKPDDMDLNEARKDGTLIYRASSGNRPYESEQPVWKPAIHMPRWASRITLEVTRVRAERLQDITRGDSMAEGCPFANMAAGPDPRDWYRDLWAAINGPDSWAANPWVWVIDFKRAKGGPR